MSDGHEQQRDGRATGGEVIVPTEKQQRLEGLLRRYRRVIVAYSGGVDSTLVLKVAVDVLGAANVLAGLGVSELQNPGEEASAVRLAEALGVSVARVSRDETRDANFVANTPARCYYCKKALFAELRAIADHRGYEGIVCGNNVDDLADFRPGNEAMQAYGVSAPLIEAGLGKAEVRALARQLGLSNWNQPANACLATRIQYHLPITRHRLKQVADAEALLKREGWPIVRVRHHDRLARIELPVDQLAEALQSKRRERIVAGIKALGFIYVTIDLQGFRSGSLNEGIAPEEPLAG